MAMTAISPEEASAFLGDLSRRYHCRPLPKIHYNTLCKILEYMHNNLYVASFRVAYYRLSMESGLQPPHLEPGGWRPPTRSGCLSHMRSSETIRAMGALGLFAIARSEFWRGFGGGGVGSSGFVLGWFCVVTPALALPGGQIRCLCDRRSVEESAAKEQYLQASRIRRRIGFALGLRTENTSGAEDSLRHSCKLNAGRLESSLRSSHDCGMVSG